MGEDGSMVPWEDLWRVPRHLQNPYPEPSLLDMIALREVAQARQGIHANQQALVELSKQLRHNVQLAAYYDAQLQRVRKEIAGIIETAAAQVLADGNNMKTPQMAHLHDSFLSYRREERDLEKVFKGAKSQITCLRYMGGQIYARKHAVYTQIMTLNTITKVSRMLGPNEKLFKSVKKLQDAANRAMDDFNANSDAFFEFADQSANDNDAHASQRYASENDVGNSEFSEAIAAALAKFKTAEHKKADEVAVALPFAPMSKVSPLSLGSTNLATRAYELSKEDS
jgi:hypothetical protein